MTEKNRRAEQTDRARLTPYELVFTDGDFESRRFPAIRAESAETVKLENLRRDRFDFVRSAGEVVREMVPAEAPPEALEQYRAILFHAFHHWAGDRRLIVCSTAVARYLVEAAPHLDEWDGVLPAPAFYLQLPANLFWSSISPDSAPEPVDGIFVTSTYSWEGDGEGRLQLDLLLILGIHRGRAGFSVIPLEADRESAIALWTEEPREAGDYANTLPGGELSGLYSILTMAEVFKLVGRVAWYFSSFPEGVVTIESDPPTEPNDEAPATQLSYQLLVLDQSDRTGG